MNADKVLKVHLSSEKGLIHYGKKTPWRSTKKPVCEFATSDIVLNAKGIQIMGTLDNAALIREILQARKSELPTSRIMIGSPTMAGLFSSYRRKKISKNAENDPAYIFRAMRANHWPSALGGWHSATLNDLVMYSLIAEVYGNHGQLTKKAKELLEAHPAWPAVSFIHRVRTSSACKLLVSIIDPRWHSDHEYPDEIVYSPLRHHLGFGSVYSDAIRTTNRMIGLLQNWRDNNLPSVPGGNSLEEFNHLLLTDMWFGNFLRHRGAMKEVLAEYVRRPQGFLVRYAYDPRRDVPLPERLLLANHRCMRFIRDVWLDNLYGEQDYKEIRQTLGKKAPKQVARSKMLYDGGTHRTLFRADDIFPEIDEREAWKEHASRLWKAKHVGS